MRILHGLLMALAYFFNYASPVTGGPHDDVAKSNADHQ